MKNILHPQGSRGFQQCAAVLLLALATCPAQAAAGNGESQQLHRTAAVGKPYASGVIVNAETTGIASIGQAFEVTVIFTQVDERGAKVTFTSDPELRLTNAKPLTLPAGRTVVRLLATPSANGLKFVNVFTRQGTGGSAISVPVQVGPVATPSDEAAQKSSDVETGPGGRAVKLLPIAP